MAAAASLEELPPLESPFWNDAALKTYAGMLRAGVPAAAVKAKMEREGALSAGGAGDAAPRVAVLPARPTPGGAGPAGATAAVPRAGPKLPPLPPRGGTPSAASDDGASPAAAPAGLLAGIAGFSKDKLKKTETVDKCALPTAAGAAGGGGGGGERRGSAPGGATPPVPAKPAGGGGSLMEEMRARAARRASAPGDS